MPLREDTPLLTPVDQDALRREEFTLRAVRDDLTAKDSGLLYYPFVFSDKRPVRTAQATSSCSPLP